ncbi:hypothetical protein [Burkholderia sp. Ac-20353]|uniref:hypothetical protein n=1 Tax=Burkholderia sp. Ac-20353 TaxID=2703894 RepID=UPI00197C40A5|nr:hypothetical protein [Burkholderia sp. Ac-20353]MBN3788148.1 hypothetical protein [Burkholderia sp. Ac-20353]
MNKKMTRQTTRHSHISGSRHAPLSCQSPGGATISGQTDVNGFTQWHDFAEPASIMFQGTGGTET